MQEIDKHTCPVSGCSVLVPYNILMCRRHWFMVPASLQRRVNRMWKRLMDDPQAYMKARQEAIDAVNAKIGAAR